MYFNRHLYTQLKQPLTPKNRGPDAVRYVGIHCRGMERMVHYREISRNPAVP
jgi:hypothetical protein